MTGTGEGLTLRVQASPGASATEVAGRSTDGFFRIRVKAPPVDGRANDELRRFLAKEFGVVRGSVKQISGFSGRRKLFRIEGATGMPEWFGQR